MTSVSSSPRARTSRAVESFKSASETIGQLEPGMALFAVTRGQFSMIDIIRHCVEQTGPCDISVWTWAIADYEVEAFEYFFTTGAIRSARLVVDRSAENRNAAIIQRWREKFGTDSVRVCKNHAKLARISGDGWKVLARGSMNLNFNPRFEQVDITEGGPDYDLVEKIEAELPVLKPKCTNAEAEKASQLTLAFDCGTMKQFGGLKTWAK